METQTLVDTADLLARQVVVAALSEAMVDRRARPLDSTHRFDANLLRRAWAVLADSSRTQPPAKLGLGELRPEETDIEPLIRWLAREPQLRGEMYQVVFGLVASRDCTPYETEYCHWSDPTYRAQQMADIAGFYRAFSVEPSDLRPERHDHVSLELEFIAFLLQKLSHAQQQAMGEGAEVCQDALKNFVRDHIVWWIPTFARCVERRVERMSPDLADTATRDALQDWAGAARVLRAWTAAERIANGVEPSQRIIAPMVEPPPAEEESCGGCAQAVPQ
ncbi:MAG: molecular chaperone TorD family protein [Phycisphaeraceae bacterium]|nr:molecular chaperone TorD family protein [Phycisphaeraceae bacterium]